MEATGVGWPEASLLLPLLAVSSLGVCVGMIHSVWYTLVFRPSGHEGKGQTR